jgi:hypothetical protein
MTVSFGVTPFQGTKPEPPTVSVTDRDNRTKLFVVQSIMENVVFGDTD